MLAGEGAPSWTSVGGYGASGLEEYETAFRENKVDAAILPKLTAEDLKDLGLAAVGDRRKPLEAIADLQLGAKPEPGV
jgi:SAM domain (Sterile alpha motif)